MQSAHALLSFQLADHWGNRATPRPAPRADVLAAVLAHDLGWDGREEPPRCGADGTPLAFDTAPATERCQAWRDSVSRAGLRGDYPGYLVSHHVSHLAGDVSTEPHDDLLAGERERRLELVGRLRADPRYRHVLDGQQDEVNRAIVRLCDAIAVYLLLGRGPVTLPGLPRRDGTADLAVTPQDGGRVRLRPWPLTGRRLTVHVEGRRLEARRFADDDGLLHAWRQGERVRLTWHLLAPGTPAGPPGTIDKSRHSR